VYTFVIPQSIPVGIYIPEDPLTELFRLLLLLLVLTSVHYICLRARTSVGWQYLRHTSIALDWDHETISFD
jgi:hypothetical protein